MSLELLTVRHGQTDDNAAGVFQGQGGRGLSALGARQAELVAQRLARLAAGASALYSSDLQRAVETARPVARALDLPIVTDRALREVDVGAWTGLDEAAVAAQFPEEHAAWTAGLDVRRGGGERYGEVGARVAAALRALAEERGEGRVVVISHGAALRCGVLTLLGVDASLWPRWAALRNTSVTRLVLDGPRVTLLTYNDAAHLEHA